MKSASSSRQVGSLFAFLGISALCGLLIAGLAVPFTALLGGTMKAAAVNLQYLPEELETPPQSERSRILMADGSVLAEIYDEYRIYKPLSDISMNMQLAQVAIEDHRFYEHGAVDLHGMARAVVKTLSGDTQGASTLTQQYVKLVQVEAAKARGDAGGVAAATEVSLERKIREMRYAMAIEERFTKDEILERYLNIAYYGDGAYGVEAAAHHYWGTTAKDLTLDQAAMLAGIVQNPVAFNPVRHPQRAMDRRDVVLNQMVKHKMITKEEAEAAKKVVFDGKLVQEVPNGCVASQFPHLCDYVRRTLISDQMPGFGNTPEEREAYLRRGGLTIQTLIDPKAQLAAEEAVSKQVSPNDAVLGGAVLIQPSTGLIVAMAQSRPKMGNGPGETYYNWNVEKSMGGAEGFQAGSTFKIFGVAAALEAGSGTGKAYNSPGSLNMTGKKFKSCEGTFKSPKYTVHNLGNRNYGTINMMTATQKSVNTYFLQLIQEYGICETVDSAERAGVKMADGKDLKTQAEFPSFVLGTADITPLSMAEAYATFANRGVHCNPIIIKSVTSQAGKELPVPSANCEQTIPEEVADSVNQVMQSVMFAPGGTGVRVRTRDGRPQAGKTGTTTANQAVWFAGYTPELAGASYMAVDKTHPWWKTHKRTLKGYRMENGKRLEGTGSGDAGQIWRPAMETALKDKPKTKFSAASRSAKKKSDDEPAQKVEVPNVTGMSYGEAQRTLQEAGFKTKRWGVYSSSSEGTLLGVSPSKTAEKNSTIRLRVSIGPKPKPKSKGRTENAPEESGEQAPPEAPEEGAPEEQAPEEPDDGEDE